PYANAELIRWTRAVRTPLASAWKMAPNDRDRLPNATAYVAFFRAGPKPYQEAYRKFVAAARETGDVVTALETHLLSLNQEEMMAAVREFGEKKLRATRPR